MAKRQHSLDNFLKTKEIIRTINHWRRARSSSGTASQATEGGGYGVASALPYTGGAGKARARSWAARLSSSASTSSRVSVAAESWGVPWKCMQRFNRAVVGGELGRLG